MHRIPILAVAILSLLAPGISSAQGEATGDARRQVIEACSEGDRLQMCPNSCAAACESTEFLMKNTEACLAALEAGPGSDDASCSALPEPETATLGACIAAARGIERRPGPILRRSESRLELFNAFFAERPECARSSIALVSMFDCLDGETDVVKREYDSLGSLGIPDRPLETSTLRELACTTSEERLLQIDIGASALKGRADRLQDQLGVVAACRRAYSAWLDGRGAVCQDAEKSFDNCEDTISIFQEDLSVALEGASEQNDKIAGVVDNLTRDLGSLISIGFIRTSCPRGG